MDTVKPQPEQEFQFTVELLKAQSAEQRYTLTPFLIPDKFDLQGDRLTKSEIEKIVWGVSLHKNLMDDEHYLVDRKMGMPVEKYVLPADTLFKKTAKPSDEVQKVLNQISDLQKSLAESHPDEVRLVPQGTAMLGTIWEPDIWEKIKNGEKNGLSIYGRGVRTAVAE